MNFESSAFALNAENKAAGEEGAQFKRTLAANLEVAESSEEAARVLAFKTKAPAPAEGYTNGLKVLYTQNKASAAGKVKVHRHIASAPERILDAPEMVDDYYLNLLDWGSNGLLAVGLGSAVYLWNAATGSAQELMRCSAVDDSVTSVSWIKEGNYLAIGTNSAEVLLWDAEKGKQVRSMKGHSARVGALDWNAHILSSGSRDASIFNHDVRIRDHHVATLAGHTQEVCGLKWSPDGTMLASGANDNTLCLWEGAAALGGERVVAPKYTMTEHQAAVKALAWCPWQKGLLASGGGTADRSIKLWNAPSGTLLNSVDTGSQVSSLLWNPHERELLSSHGFSQNQLCLWKYPTMTKVKELTGHTARILHMAASPDGSCVVSAGADESLRFWNVFGEGAAAKDAKVAVAGSPNPIRGMAIR